MKKALLTGITGQDGSYLAELLLSKDYEIHTQLAPPVHAPAEIFHDVMVDAVIHGIGEGLAQRLTGLNSSAHVVHKEAVIPDGFVFVESATLCYVFISQKTCSVLLKLIIKSIGVLRYAGEWKDLGTWNTLKIDTWGSALFSRQHEKEPQSWTFFSYSITQMDVLYSGHTGKEWRKAYEK